MITGNLYLAVIFSTVLGKIKTPLRHRGLGGVRGDLVLHNGCRLKDRPVCSLK